MYCIMWHNTANTYVMAIWVYSTRQNVQEHYIKTMHCSVVINTIARAVCPLQLLPCVNKSASKSSITFNETALLGRNIKDNSRGTWSDLRTTRTVHKIKARDSIPCWLHAIIPDWHYLWSKVNTLDSTIGALTLMRTWGTYCHIYIVRGWRQ